MFPVTRPECSRLSPGSGETVVPDPYSFTVLNLFGKVIERKESYSGVLVPFINPERRTVHYDNKVVTVEMVPLRLKSGTFNIP